MKKYKCDRQNYSRIMTKCGEDYYYYYYDFIERKMDFDVVKWIKSSQKKVAHNIQIAIEERTKNEQWTKCQNVCV